MTQLAHVAALAEKLPGQLVGSRLRAGRVRLFGVKAWLALSVNDDEWRRREGAGLDGVTGLDVLDVLLGLPLGMSVRVDAMTTRERRLVSRLPDGVVEQRDGAVVRRAEPVIEVTLAVVFARSWPTGLVSASRFASYCPRLMVLSSRPVDEVSACTQASFYGTGVAVLAGNDPVMLMPPEPLVDRRVSAAGWWFTEEVYRQVKSAGLVDLATREAPPMP